MHSRTRAWLVRKLQPSTIQKLSSNSRNKSLVFCYLYMLASRHQGSAADGGQLPRGHRREQAMILIGLIIITAVLTALVVPRIRRKLGASAGQKR